MMSKPTSNSTRALKCLLEMVPGPSKGALVASAKLAFTRSRHPLLKDRYFLAQRRWSRHQCLDMTAEDTLSSRPNLLLIRLGMSEATTWQLYSANALRYS
ncbi:hypothetical protein D5086_025344 [Populus alba]|uniref:Uncharacterized protein n=1 Tax=Populus alba TaxID=43335 RepID=A0ACC4AZ80_POPAL